VYVSATSSRSVLTRATALQSGIAFPPPRVPQRSSSTVEGNSARTSATRSVEEYDSRTRDRASSEQLNMSDSLWRTSSTLSRTYTDGDGANKHPSKADSYYSGSADTVASASQGRAEQLSVMRDRLKMTEDSQSLVIVMVGLPARGKSFTARKLERFLR
jgi:hypothetical protein